MSSDMISSRMQQSFDGDALNQAHQLFKLKVFVPSPQDMFNEGRASAVVEILKRMGSNAADELGVVLEVLGWHTHVSSFAVRIRFRGEL